MPRPVPVPDLRAMGWQIKTLRHERGMTIEQLAEESDLGRRTILSLEAGQKSANVRSVHAIAHALGVPVSTLVEPLCGGHDRPN